MLCSWNRWLIKVALISCHLAVVDHVDLVPPPFPRQCSSRPLFSVPNAVPTMSPYMGTIPPRLNLTCATHSLVDATGRPSEVFSRLADAFFFWLDQNCDIPGLRNTGFIEPAKYAWMSVKMGFTPEAVRPPSDPRSFSR